jgi:hypothetical protein
MPSMWEWPEFVEGGGLMSYGTSIMDSFRLGRRLCRQGSEG